MPPTESTAAAPGVDSAAMTDWFDRTRARSTALFDLPSPDAFLDRPIPLRHPIIFYEGHIPVFAFNTVIRKALGRPGINAEFEQLFARGIDPENEAEAARRGIPSWPAREAIRQYAAEADRQVREAIRSGEVARPGHPMREQAQAAFASIEHEAMHQETLLYIFHRLPLDRKRAPAQAKAQGPRSSDMSALSMVPRPQVVHVPAGCATLGVGPGEALFSWDNERQGFETRVPAFDIDVYNVTNRDYLEFVEAGGYDAQELWTRDGWAWRTGFGVHHPLFWERHDDGWFWRAQFDLVPLPPAWPVYVSHAEATAYARWRGRRLPTEAEYHRAAFGTPSGEERPMPWGAGAPDPMRHGNFDFTNWDPVPVGSYPQGVSAWGVHDLVGNGWEWTSTVFEPFPGFDPIPSYPEYSADFFDGQHYVMKGASPATARELVRRSFRNWFRPEYPYMYATFRLVNA